MTNTKRFIFLEIEHREISSLLWRMQWILADAEPRHPVHLTVRGPYRQKVPRKILSRCREVLDNDTLRICDVGRFMNVDQQVVFLRVECQNLRKIWWKPNYKIRDHGFTPHISLYRGRDATFADRVADFLRREQIELICDRYRLTVHLSDGLHFGADQPTAFEETTWPVEAGRINPSLLSRLRKFVNAYRASTTPLAAASTGSRGRSLDADSGGTTLGPRP